jgi:hypothetical protein
MKSLVTISSLEYGAYGINARQVDDSVVFFITLLPERPGRAV